MNGELPALVALPAALLLIAGGLAALIGALGLFRLRTFAARMHPSAIGATLGTGCVLAASMLIGTGLLHRPVVHEIVIAALLVVTAPVSAITLMRAARSRASGQQRQENEARRSR